MTPQQRKTIETVVDCCADIRRLYGAIVLRGESEASLYDTARLTSLEGDLAEYCDTAVEQGLDPDEVKAILYRILPPDRFKQFSTA